MKRLRISFELNEPHAQAVDEMFGHFHRDFPQTYPTKDEMIRQLIEDLIDDYNKSGGWERLILD